jgi:hypothetical protein
MRKSLLKKNLVAIDPGVINALLHRLSRHSKNSVASVAVMLYGVSSFENEGGLTGSSRSPDAVVMDLMQGRPKPAFE